MGAEAATTPRTADEAEAMGWTVDRHTYPWCAYIGPRFDPERCVVIATPEPPPCICGHAKVDHLGRMDDCTAQGCPCPLYTLRDGSGGEA